MPAPPPAPPPAIEQQRSSPVAPRKLSGAARPGGSMSSLAAGAASADAPLPGHDRDDRDEEKGTLLDRRSSKTMRQLAQAAQAPKEAMHQIVHSWFSRKFATGCAILLPIVITFYVTFHFLKLFDGIFSPLYKRFLGYEVFGLGFMTSVLFIMGTGVFCSSWMGAWALALGEWIIKRLPLVKHIYSASKQVSGALSPDSGEGSKAFQECVLARHPRHGEYAIAFITGRTLLQTHEGDVRLTAVYIPTNHVYVGDIYLLDERDLIHTNLTVREGLEIVVSVGMALPPALSAISRRRATGVAVRRGAACLRPAAAGAMRAARAAAAACLLCLAALCGAVHHEGDFIHTSRRAQFLRKRTAWHDLIEHHCPRFGHTRIVALPINKPGSEVDAITDYRIQLSFDGDRILTPWLTVIGRGVEGMPLLDVELRRAGDELQGAKARVLALPDELLLTHSALFDAYKNTSAWPKHVLLRYHFTDEGDVDFNAGLYVVLTAGLVLFGVLGVSTLAGVQAKLGQFMRDVVGADAAAFDPLGEPGGTGGGLPPLPPPYVPFKGGSHVE
ncbi:COV1 [Scenedesmus sp. PABB004]|nr:COV1 [Scenedesmus sp. PABB004]